MLKNLYDLNAGIANLFPEQIKIHDVSLLTNCANTNSPSLLHKHFWEPLSKEMMDQLVFEIADFLREKEQAAVYSFFYCNGDKDKHSPQWFISSARLNKCEKGLPKDIVIFTYNLELLGDERKRFYRVLEQDEFFKDHFDQVAALTKREREIIGLLSSGMSNPEIATAMYISVHTVNAHRKSINEKLAIQNIAGLLKFAEVFNLATIKPTIK